MSTNIKTTFAGLELKSPIIAAASPLTATAEQCLQLEKAGIAAIVVKSIFEKSIAQNAHSISDMLAHGEQIDYLDGYIGEQMVADWRNSLRDIKAVCTIPIIASIAAQAPKTWVRYAQVATEEGVDAIELNMVNVGLCSRKTKYGEVEQQFLDIVERVRKATQLPIVIKLAANITNPAALIDRFAAIGVKGIVLFNRPYPIDIDIEKGEYITGHTSTSKSFLARPLRWTGILSAEIASVDYALSGGVQTWEDVVKSILAGASAVEICSTLYKNGLDYIAEMERGLIDWQTRHFEEDIEAYRGRMNAARGNYADDLLRAQYLHYTV